MRRAPLNASKFRDAVHEYTTPEVDRVSRVIVFLKLDPLRFRYGSINSIDVKFKELIQDIEQFRPMAMILALR